MNENERIDFFHSFVLITLLRGKQHFAHKLNIAIHCKNEYPLSNQYNCGNRLQAILLIKCNKLELSNNSSNYSLKVNHLK